MTDFEFLLARRMWAVRSGNVLVAPEKFPYDHFNWLCGLCGLEIAQEMRRTATMGFFLGDTIVAYKGLDLAGHELDLMGVFDAVKAVGGLCGPVLNVGLGVLPGPGLPWPPVQSMRISEFNELVARIGRVQRGKPKR